MAIAKKPRRNYKRFPRRKPAIKMNTLSKMIKNVQLKQCETKRSSQYTDDPVILFHNGTYYTQFLLATNQGTQNPNGLDQAEGNRVGDEVIAKGLQLKWLLSNASDRPNVSYKIIVFEYSSKVQTMNDGEFWSGTDGVGSNMTRLLDRPNTDKIKVLKVIHSTPTREAQYSVQATSTGPWEKSHYHTCYIPMKNRKIQYNQDGGSNTRFRNIGFAVLAYDTFSTLQTDRLAKMQWASTFYYKDP